MKKLLARYKVIFVVIVLIILILIAIGTLVAVKYFERAPVQYAQAVGTVTFGQDQGRLNAVINYEAANLQPDGSDGTGSHNSANACLINMFGYDDKYIYASANCIQTYTYSGTSQISTSGSLAYARYTYDASSGKVTGRVAQGDDNINPSLESIYPLSVYNFYLSTLKTF